MKRFCHIVCSTNNLHMYIPTRTHTHTLTILHPQRCVANISKYGIYIIFYQVRFNCFCLAFIASHRTCCCCCGCQTSIHQFSIIPRRQKPMLYFTVAWDSYNDKTTARPHHHTVRLWVYVVVHCQNVQRHHRQNEALLPRIVLCKIDRKLITRCYIENVLSGSLY